MAEGEVTKMQRSKPDWFYWFMVAYTLPHLVWMGVCLFEFIRRPLAPDPLSGTVAYRLFIVFGLTPLSLAVSFLVLRRTPGNVTGLCLLLWSALNLGRVVPADSPIYMLNRAFNTGWTGSLDVLSCALNSAAQQIALGDKLSYNWVCGG